MRNVIKQWVVVVASIFLAVGLRGWLLQSFKAADGQIGVPLMLCDGLLGALLPALAACLWFGIIAVVAGWVTHRYTGLLVYGLCWIFVTAKSAPVDDLVRMIADTGRSFTPIYWSFALESVIWTIPAAVVLAILTRFARNRYKNEDGWFAASTIIGFALCTALTLVLAWVVVRTDEVGQAVFGFAFASLLATAIARLGWPTCNGGALFIVPLVVGVIGAISSAFMMGERSLELVTAGTTWPLARVTPLVYVTSGFIGVSLGIWLARSFGPDSQPAGSNSSVATA
jgi:hypothetical protein